MKISDIKIDEEFRKLVLPLSDQEKQSLRSSMKETNGNVVPILLRKEDNTIYDGHHRYDICQEDNYEPKVEICNIEFQNRDEEILFVIDCNLNRRHLNTFQRVELALKKKPILENIARENMSLGGKWKGRGVKNVTPLGRVDQKIADDAGTSRGTVTKVETILAKSDNELISNGMNTDFSRATITVKELKDKLRQGKERIHNIHERIKREEKKQEWIKQREKEIKEKEEQREKEKANYIFVYSNSGKTYLELLKRLPWSDEDMERWRQMEMSDEDIEDMTRAIWSDEDIEDLKQQLDERENRQGQEYWWLTEEERQKEIQKDKEYEEFDKEYREKYLEKREVSKKEIIDWLLPMDESARFNASIYYARRVPPRNRPLAPEDNKGFTLKSRNQQK